MHYIVSQNYLCFLSLMEMILEDTLNYHLFTQESLAETFGIVLPYGEESPISNVTYSNNVRDYGIHINEEKLNKFFTMTGIPLFAEYIAANPFANDAIDDALDNYGLNDNYIIFTYSYGSLYNESSLTSLGHVALLDKVISNQSILIYDPGPKNPGLKTVGRIQMNDAMVDRKAGIYIFKKC